MASSRRSGVSSLLSVGAIERAVCGAGLAELTPRAIEQFEIYLGLLLKWNRRLNLMAVREPERIIHRHFVECIQCAQNLPDLLGEATLLDFGSGAGLPGLPIAICCPQIRVTLAESQGKKVAFLREVVRSLGLAAEVYDGRVEDMPIDQLFSVVTLRAVDRMISACQAALGRVVPEGWIMPFATRSTAAEIEAALPEVDWTRKLPIVGTEQSLMLFGRRHQ